MLRAESASEVSIIRVHAQAGFVCRGYFEMRFQNNGIPFPNNTGLARASGSPTLGRKSWLCESVPRKQEVEQHEELFLTRDLPRTLMRKKFAAFEKSAS